jgi:hypothetical protein
VVDEIDNDEEDDKVAEDVGDKRKLRRLCRIVVYADARPPISESTKAADDFLSRWADDALTITMLLVVMKSSDSRRFIFNTGMDQQTDNISWCFYFMIQH